MPHLTAPVAAIIAFVSYSGPKTDLTPWFDSLRSPGGGFCCAKADGRDTDYDTKNGKYTVVINGKTVVIPDDRVLTVPNLHGHAMVWLDYQGAVRCFLPADSY
jgi:hypothetical protein